MVKYSRPAGDAINVNVRVPSGLIESVDRYVEAAQFKSRSEFIVASMRFYLDHMAFMNRHEVYRFEGDTLRPSRLSSHGNEESPSERS